MATPDYSSLSVESATITVQQSAWSRVRRNVSVRIGGSIMLLLVLVALAAPWLGTVDPSLFDPASRDLLPGKTGEIVWTFNRAGQFQFACLIAGHYSAGMVGTINVTA